MPTRPRIYLAGPEVFLPNALEIAAAKRELCARAGFEGRFPLDAQVDLEGLAGDEKARRIALADEGLMLECDLAIANLTPFRGVSMDSGTAYEVGFMRARGCRVLGYTNLPEDYNVRADAFRAARRGARPRWPEHGDVAGVEVEDFGLAENLMIEIAIRESGGTVVRTAVAPGSELTDLAGFGRCLEQATALCLPR